MHFLEGLENSHCGTYEGEASNSIYPSQSPRATYQFTLGLPSLFSACITDCDPTPNSNKYTLCLPIKKNLHMFFSSVFAVLMCAQNAFLL